MLNPYRYIYIYSASSAQFYCRSSSSSFEISWCPATRATSKGVLRSFAHDSEIHSSWWPGRFMLRTMKAAIERAKRQLEIDMYIIYYILYNIIYILHTFERYQWRHAKKWRRPGCVPLFWFEFAQAFSILWCSDWSDSRKTSWWLPMVQWYHDIKRTSPYSAAKGWRGHCTAWHKSPWPLPAQDHLSAFLNHFVFCLSKAHKIWCATQSAELVSLHVPIQCTMVFF